MSLRAAWRGILLALSLLFCLVRFWAMLTATRLRGKAVTPHQRAQWMHFCGLITLRALGIPYRVEGEIPTGPTLIVANHLSYLDIAIASAALPCALVAKQEIATWIGFGPLARMGGNIFVDRDSRISAWRAAESIAERLAAGVPVLVFPEGTSTDGSEVGRFNSPLFAPVIAAGLPITPMAVYYRPAQRQASTLTERDLCWYGDAAFLPHLLSILGIPGTASFTAVVRFGQPEIHPERKAAAYRTHNAVEILRSTGLQAHRKAARPGH